ncbi:MAG: hypothetical protein JXR63_10455 [Spirochaetales bacterium]|nr:hypothetical protein [Spirochaetales bacterium]
MRKSFIFFLLNLGFLLSCTITYVEVEFEPVYMEKEGIRSLSDTAREPQEISAAGKIWLYEKENGQKILFLSEIFKGVHLMDISDSSNIKQLCFIEIPGNQDIAVSDDGKYLYADSAFDLLVFDVSNIDSIKKVETLQDCFANYGAAECGSYISVRKQLKKGEYATYKEVDKSKGVVVDWKRGKATTKIGLPKICAENSAGGAGGSRARFSIANNHLYIVNWKSMKIFNLSDPSNIPSEYRKIEMESGIETIVQNKRPEGNYLLIGAINGVYFYSIEDPLNPKLVSKFTHVVARDPVIAATDPETNKIYAFSTIQSWQTNNFFALDISDINAHKVIEEKKLQNPQGLSCDWPFLFVCDTGIKMFSISTNVATGGISVNTASPVASTEDFLAIDVISWNGTLIAIKDDGIQLYDYSSFMNPSAENPALVKKGSISWAFRFYHYY